MFALNDKARDIFLFLILHIITIEIQRQRILKKLNCAQYKEQSNKVYEVIVVEDKRIFRLLEYYKATNQLEYPFFWPTTFFSKKPIVSYRITLVALCKKAKKSVLLFDKRPSFFVIN